ncbi:hypothetical protein CAT62_18855 [Acinetobacter pittii]|nr:hypothetical protein CAT62_18855 [Acinetobacter pittii]OTU50045.1 hypothetical protein CAT36_15900 [Acinetobacter pittii]QDB83887.1 hypothetical protein APMS7_16730 [Acinetobacter pittii]
MIHLIILLLFQKIRGNFTLYLRREKPEVYLIGANFNKIDLEKANVKKLNQIIDSAVVIKILNIVYFSINLRKLKFITIATVIYR